MSRSLLLSLPLLFLLFVDMAVADALVVRIASGPPGGSYHDLYARNLAKLLPDYEVIARNTTGSGENIELLADGSADLAFAQTDVYADRLLGNPDRYHALEVLGKVGDECVYMANRKDGPVTQFVQLTKPVGERGARVAFGPETGGMRGTWRYLVHLLPELQRASVHDDGGTTALNRLAIGGYEAVGWVTDPDNLEHKLLRAVLGNDSLELMNVNHPALSGALPNGIKVYEAKTIRVAGGSRTPKIKTICTSALMLARGAADRQLVERVSDILGLELDRLKQHEE